MKLSKATTFLALCAAAVLVTIPSVTVAQSSSAEPTASATPQRTTASPTSRPPASTTNPSSIPAPTTTTQQPVVPQPTTTTVAAPNPVTTKSNAPTTTAAAPTTSATPPLTDGACVNSSTCADGLICALAATNGTTGTCIPMRQDQRICISNPVRTCITSADCNAEFSMCARDNGQMVCAGNGNPGTPSACDPSKASQGDGGVASTLKYAGIGVGSVAALAVAFALVRWQRRSQRSKTSANMFEEVDYGMTDRPPKSAEQNYPFSSRPNAHGNDNAPSPHNMDYGYDNNQYYEEPIGYTNNKDQYYGQDQYYGNNKDGGYGYDQRGGQGEFYNNAGYDNYQQHPVTSPAMAARSPRQNYNNMDNYGADQHSDMGYHHEGQGGHGGYGRY
ncbi:hypothetical protein BG011_003169 [Mortierella polycephala]|uniref:Uncharacterized protein n=1 Tax=Mortierella polycephala TaxID=41804 RepID=A0A9P6Q1R5_9FUNG|nr:hypothetical protein BG011_003169 [Mortierella polycephala]